MSRSLSPGCRWSCGSPGRGGRSSATTALRVGARPFHRITINDDLNPYAFLTTFLHELAHAATWDRHRGRRRLRPHGPEWKAEFGGILRPVVEQAVLPAAVTAALARYAPEPRSGHLHRPGARAGPGRVRPAAGGTRAGRGAGRGDVLPPGRGTIFRAGRMIRSRRACFEQPGGREYRVHGLALVEPIEPPASRRARRQRGT